MSREQIEEMAKVIKSSLDGLGCGNFNFTGDEISTMFAKALYNADYRKQSENVIEPPCKIGDEVYCIMAKGGLSGGLVFTGHIIKQKVDKLIYDGKRWEMMSDRVYPDYKDGNGLIYAYFDDLVFVSEEEANNRLKEILAVGEKMMKGGAE